MANEKRLIQRFAERLIEAFPQADRNNPCPFLCFDSFNDIVWDIADEMVDGLEEASTVDAVEVVHGRWIPLEYDGYADGNPVWDLWECSECREEHSGDEDTLTPYCPNCGAKMDGDENA